MAALKAIDQEKKALVDSPFLTQTRRALISGRDSAQIVTGEVLRFWKPSALIMVGIAFGRDSQRQRIGDVLISERIIAYEPERVGSESTISRGQQFLPGIRLFNSFRNADMDWSFRNPNGLPCALHFGPMLSGEKLIDNPEFKSRLFEKHPTAIGGEMEGVGVASCMLNGRSMSAFSSKRFATGQTARRIRRTATTDSQRPLRLAWFSMY